MPIRICGAQFLMLFRIGFGTLGVPAFAVEAH